MRGMRCGDDHLQRPHDQEKTGGSSLPGRLARGPGPAHPRRRHHPWHARDDHQRQWLRYIRKILRAVRVLCSWKTAQKITIFCCLSEHACHYWTNDIYWHQASKIIGKREEKEKTDVFIFTRDERLKSVNTLCQFFLKLFITRCNRWQIFSIRKIWIRERFKESKNDKTWLY